MSQCNPLMLYFFVSSSAAAPPPRLIIAPFCHLPHPASTSSYVTVYPPPLYSLTSPSYAHPLSGSSSRFLYSAGGPTGEVHQLERDGRIGEKLQEVVFLAQGEQALHAADKTRKALVS